ncbi:MAG: hypothetical protein ACKVTZ_16285 [Bacteroidia bacterium]
MDETREINQHIQNIIAFCKEQSITLVMGNVEDLKQAQVKWVGNHEGVYDWEHFLEVAIQLKANLVILEKHLCAPMELFDEVLPFFDQIQDKYVKKQFEQAVQEYGTFEDEVMVFQLYFFANDICFRYKETAEDIRPKAEEILRIIDTAKEISEIEEDFYQEELEENLKHLETQIQEDAMYLAANEAFQRAKTYDQRLHIAQQLFLKTTPEEEIEEAMGVEAYWKKLIRKATTLYEVEIRPQKEAELIQKIQALKEKGHTKKQITEILKISMYLLNKLD